MEETYPLGNATVMQLHARGFSGYSRIELAPYDEVNVHEKLLTSGAPRLTSVKRRSSDYTTDNGSNGKSDVELHSSN